MPPIQWVPVFFSGGKVAGAWRWPPPSSAGIKSEFRRKTTLLYPYVHSLGAGSIPDAVIGTFHWCSPFGRTMALGSTQPLSEMSATNISWRGKGGPCAGLTFLTPLYADRLEIWETQPRGTLRACNSPVQGWLYLYRIHLLEKESSINKLPTASTLRGWINMYFRNRWEYYEVTVVHLFANNSFVTQVQEKSGRRSCLNTTIQAILEHHIVRLSLSTPWRNVGGVAVQLHTLLTAAVDGGEWSASCSGRFTTGKEPRYSMNRGLRGTQSRPGRFEELKRTV